MKHPASCLLSRVCFEITSLMNLLVYAFTYNTIFDIFPKDYAVFGKLPCLNIPFTRWGCRTCCLSKDCFLAISTLLAFLMGNLGGNDKLWEPSPQRQRQPVASCSLCSRITPFFSGIGDKCMELAPLRYLLSRDLPPALSFNRMIDCGSVL